MVQDGQEEFYLVSKRKTYPTHTLKNIHPRRPRSSYAVSRARQAMESSYTQDTPSSSNGYEAATVSAVSWRADTVLAQQNVFPPRLSDVVCPF